MKGKAWWGGSLLEKDTRRGDAIGLRKVSPTIVQQCWLSKSILSRVS